MISRERMEKKLAAYGPFGAGLLCLVLYTISSAKGITWGDSPEISQAVALLGVMHPTGYPFFILSGKLLTSLLFFVDDPAQRLNYVVGFWGAATVTLLALSTRRVILRLSPGLGPTPWIPTLAGMLTALSYGCSAIFFEQARIAEVYTLHVAILGLALWLWLRFEESGERKLVFYLALVMGLGLAHHLTIVHLFPAALALLLAKGARFFATWRFPAACAIGASPFLLYLYLPIADLTTTGFPWGGTSEWGFFWYHISGSHYHHYLFESAATAVRHLHDLPVKLFSHLGPVGLAALLWGFVELGRKAWRLLLLLGLYLLFSLTHAVGYNVSDWNVYLCAPFYVVTVVAGVGLGRGLLWLAARIQNKSPLAAVLGIGALLASGFVAVGILAGFQVKEYLEEMPFVPEMAEEVTRTLEAGDILLLQGDTNCYSTWYTQNVRGIGRDAAAINVLRVRDRWYVEFLKERWPFMELPTMARTDRVARETLRRYSGKRKIYERGVYTGRDARLEDGYRMVNRGFINEILPDPQGSKKPVYVGESYLTAQVEKGKPGLPGRRFMSQDRIHLVVKWFDPVDRKTEVRFIAPDGSVYETRPLEVSGRTGMSWVSLAPTEARPQGSWRVEMHADGEEILGYGFEIAL